MAQEGRLPLENAHREFEINYIENAAGAQRVVGDSIEEIGDYELALISNGNLEHGWQNHNRPPGTIREITIQFSDDWLSEKLLDKNQFHSIQTMFQNGCKGIAFSLATILRVRPLLNSLTCEQQGLYLVITFLTQIYELSISHDQPTWPAAPSHTPRTTSRAAGSVWPTPTCSRTTPATSRWARWPAWSI